MNSRLRLFLSLLLLIAVVALGNLLTQWIIDGFDFKITPLNEAKVHRLIMTSMIAYAILMAIPFVPAAEIGLAVMMILGPKIVPLVYLCTLISLMLSFLVGRFIPDKALVTLLKDLRLHRASRFLGELESLDASQRLNLILTRSPRRLFPFLIRHRYIALLLSINLPGNIVIGGGGGIAMMAGMSRLFSAPYYFLTIAIAVAPFPLLLVTFGEYFGDWPLN